MKVGIKAARLPCSELENETHLMTFSLLGAAIELDASDLRVIQREPVTVEMLCDGNIRPSLGNASQVFSKTFPKSAPYEVLRHKMPLIFQLGTWQQRGLHSDFYFFLGPRASHYIQKF